VVNVFIKNMDKGDYKLAKMLAARDEKTVAEILGAGIRVYARQPKKLGLNAIKPVSFGKGTEKLSQQVDEILDGMYRDGTY
jgi:hypothetical protein